MILQVQLLDHLVNQTTSQSRRLDSLQRGVVLHVLIHGHRVEDGVELGAIADELAAFGEIFDDVHAFDGDGALGGLLVRGDRLENGRFTGTVDTKKREAFALAESESEVFDRVKLAAGGEWGSSCLVDFGEISNANAQIRIVHLLHPSSLVLDIIVLLIFVVDEVVDQDLAFEDEHKAARPS